MFYLFYRIYGHFVFRSPQPPLGANDGAVRPEDYPRREGCVRDKWEAQSLRPGADAAFSGKKNVGRRSVKNGAGLFANPRPVLAMPNNVPAKATCGWFWVPFATKRYKASAAYAAVKAALPTKKRQTTPVEECKYLLQPGDTQKIPALKTQGFSRRTAKPGAMRPDYRIPYLRRIFRIRGSRSEIMRS